MILQVVILLVTAVNISEQCKYMKFTPQHSACQSRNPRCKIIGASLSKSEKDLIVKLHNKYRSKIAQGLESRAGGMPPAADMMEMVWDDELAMIAQKHAEQCKEDAHDCHECRQVDRFGVGQNMYYHSASLGSDRAERIKSGIEAWYDEVKDYKKNFVSQFRSTPFAMVGHFTQMVWAKSTHLGCGLIEYKDEKNWNALKLFCNYGPTGNFIGQPVYKEGSACSSCPAGSRCSNTFRGLCKMTNRNNKVSIPNEFNKGFVRKEIGKGSIRDASQIGSTRIVSNKGSIPSARNMGSFRTVSHKVSIPNTSQWNSFRTVSHKGSIPNTSQWNSFRTVSHKVSIPNTSQRKSFRIVSNKDSVAFRDYKTMPKEMKEMLSAYMKFLN